LCVRYINDIIRQIKKSPKNCKIEVIFAGDFNFVPTSRAAKVLRNDLDLINNKEENIKREENNKNSTKTLNEQQQFSFFLLINWFFWTLFGNLFGANWLPKPLEDNNIEKIKG